MSISNSRQSYSDCYEVLDRALEDELGVRVQMKDRDAAIFFRMRVHQARKINRRDNVDQYEVGHPMHGASVYDKLMVRIKHEGEAVWIYVEKTAIPGNVESLSGQVAAPCDHADCDEPSITNLDGDNLCKEHADAWVRSEGQAELDDLPVAQSARRRV